MVCGNSAQAAHMTSITDQPETADTAPRRQPVRRQNLRRRPVLAHVRATLLQEGWVAQEGQPSQERGTKAARRPTFVPAARSRRCSPYWGGRGGATAKELTKATGRQPHSVRGFLSGTIGTTLGLTITSNNDKDGERRYSVKS